MLVQNIFQTVAQLQINPPHDAGDHCASELLALLGLLYDKLRFTQWFEVLGSILSILDTALDINRFLNSVTRAGIVIQLFSQVIGAGIAPQMVMWVDYWQVRFDDFLDNLIQPCLIAYRQIHIVFSNIGLAVAAGHSSNKGGRQPLEW
jgi:hypothetical protein